MLLQPPAEWIERVVIVIVFGVNFEVILWRCFSVAPLERMPPVFTLHICSTEEKCCDSGPFRAEFPVFLLQQSIFV
jgi:hypothetical protein